MKSGHFQQLVSAFPTDEVLQSAYEDQCEGPEGAGRSAEPLLKALNPCRDLQDHSFSFYINPSRNI